MNSTLGGTVSSAFDDDTWAAGGCAICCCSISNKGGLGRARSLRLTSSTSSERCFMLPAWLDINGRTSVEKSSPTCTPWADSSSPPRRSCWPPACGWGASPSRATPSVHPGEPRLDWGRCQCAMPGPRRAKERSAAVGVEVHHKLGVLLGWQRREPTSCKWWLWGLKQLSK